ncbi:MAG: hypothetical protein AB1938_14845 [Myxococcota bacterium]
MCVKQREGFAVVVNCGDIACVEASLATLARAAHEDKRHHVIRRHWVLRGFNPGASASELAEARRVKAFA